MYIYRRNNIIKVYTKSAMKITSFILKISKILKYTVLLFKHLKAHLKRKMCWIRRMKWHTIWKMMDRLVRKQILEWMMTASNLMSMKSTVRGLKISYVLQLLWNLQKSHDFLFYSHESWFKRISNWIYLLSILKHNSCTFIYFII